MNYRSVLSTLRLGTELLGKIPNRRDSLPEVLSKLLAMADSVQKVYGIAKPENYVRNLIDRYELVPMTSDTLVSLFFNTELRGAFDVNRFSVENHLNLVEAKAKDGERLYFQEHLWGKPEISSEFWHTPAFRFDKVSSMFWKQYPAGVFLSVEQTGNYGGKTPTFTMLNTMDRVPLSASAEDRLARVVETQRKFFDERIPRAYLCTGSPGTGKTTFAIKMTEAFGGRALQIDSSALAHVGVKELDLILKTLEPRFLILDDIDRADMSAVSARVLFVLQRLKNMHKQMCTILTVNDPSKLDSAILRCGRVDVPIEFEDPTVEERREVIEKYLSHHGVEASGAFLIGDVVEETKHLTHAYLADLCMRFKYEPASEVIASVKLLHKLASQAQSGGPQTKQLKPADPSATPDIIKAS